MEQTSTLTVNPHGATSFPKFRELPAELRIKVWQFAMPGARTVIIKSPHTRKNVPTSLDEALPQALDGEMTWQSTTRIPALLHVSAEARHEALKHYSLALGVDKAQPRVYIDFNRDTIFFGDAELTPECSPLWTKTNDLEKVRRLAVVPEGAWRALRWTNVDLTSLKTLIFVDDTEKIKPGCQAHLVEDEPSVAELILQFQLEQQIQQLETTMAEVQLELENPMKQRIQAARDELDTLKMVLPVEWEKDLVVSTAVFREGRVC
ncbi:hypothetical protein E0Z10_g7623 [Xylaria hypoxylon]|uniref:2EXR domain-containing protein n=1 Tax=Xylaria hypoxylon TaxID=37992 RepID=A0A4Z0YB32_9PEZI|nr:hypothetical protein E0Z10_g7623 [Xylaria hypoxylon]